MIKNKIIYVLFLVILTVLFVSCQYELPQNLSHEKSYEETSDTPAPDIEWITPIEHIDTDMNIYWQNNIYFADKDENANIYIYTDAEKNDNGEFMFDTGHEWLLIVETPFGDYTLFPRKRLQHGKIFYTAFAEFDGNSYDILHVLVTVSDSAGYEIYDCIFDNDRKAFKIVPVYNASNINLMCYN